MIIRDCKFFAVATVLVLLTCNVFTSASESEGKLKVFVSIAPQAYFVDRIGGDHVAVEVLVEPGYSPATFEPSHRQMAMLGEAHVYFHIGLPFEDRLVTKIEEIFTSLRIIDMRDGIESAPQCESVEHDAHESSGDGHHHGDRDPHVWLDPMLVKIMARNIAEELSSLDSLHTEEYSRNLDLFSADLDNLNKQLAEKLLPLKGRRFYVFHPAYSYFGRAYGLTQVSIESDGKEPGVRALTVLVERAKAENVKVIFVQPQFSKKSAQAIADAIGGVVVPMDPLSYDYLKGLEDIAEKLTLSLGLDKDEP